MNDTVLLDSEAAGAAPLAEVGGKARYLGLLARYGLPVPPFLVIPASWSRQRREDFPPALRQQLALELASRGWLEQPLAVRSSAVGEDSGDASYAGIFVSRLNVQGLEAVVGAVTEVWASLDSAAARAYRQKLGLADDQAMAVVIMPLLPARAAGIAFSCDPRSGRGDRMVVHANWGLGESLVGGEAEGDEYVFGEDDCDQWRLLTQRLGSKTVQRLPLAAGGTAAQPVPMTRAAAPVLDRAAAECLAALLYDAAIALDYVTPFYDLEWVWDGVRFWLTQARPVTRRPHHTYPALQDQPALWTRGNTGEIMPDPLSPMDWSFSRRGVNHLLEQGWAVAGATPLPGAQRAGQFAGRLYLEAAIMQWEAWDAIGLAPERFNALMGGHQPVIRVAPPRRADRWRHLSNTLRYVMRAPAMRKRGEAEVVQAHSLARQLLADPLPDSAAAISAQLYRLLQPARQARGMLFLQGSGGGGLSLLLGTLERHFPGESEALGAALLAVGEPSVTARQGYALLELASLAKAIGFDRPWRDDPRFATALAAFLAEYGHRGHYETYLRNPRWWEQPEAILAQLPALAEVDRDAIRQRQRRAADDAWQRIRRRVPWWRQALIRAQVKMANRECNQRESARSGLIALLAAGRKLWLGAAELMVRGGQLRRAEDIFLLLPHEAARALSGEIGPLGLQARVAARQVRFDGWLTETPVEWFSLTPAGQHQVAEAHHPASGHPSGRNGEGDAWRGVATGTGVVRGRARILRHPAEGDRLQPGEILVAPSTDPGWTPLFLKAGGLVVETGGYLSHAAIVAREFALPAVVNLPGIVATLADGDEIEVDGYSGSVRRLAQAREG